VVHQACGVVKYQSSISIEAALLRIRGYAYAHDLPLAVVARQIVDGELRVDGEQ
jgi:hypothetical protein